MVYIISNPSNPNNPNSIALIDLATLIALIALSNDKLNIILNTYFNEQQLNNPNNDQQGEQA